MGTVGLFKGFCSRLEEIGVLTRHDLSRSLRSGWEIKLSRDKHPGGSGPLLCFLSIFEVLYCTTQCLQNCFHLMRGTMAMNLIKEPFHMTLWLCQKRMQSDLAVMNYLQGSSIRPFPGCENAAGKLRQKCHASAGIKFTKPGARLTYVHPFPSHSASCS